MNEAFFNSLVSKLNKIFKTFFGCLTDAVAVCEAKDAFDLVECDMLLDLDDIPVKLWRGPVGKRNN